MKEYYFILLETGNEQRNKKLDKESKKIKVIPHGADTSKYNPSVKPLTYDHGKFNFGSVLTGRKERIQKL